MIYSLVRIRLGISVFLYMLLIEWFSWLVSMISISEGGMICVSVFEVVMVFDVMCWL